MTFCIINCQFEKLSAVETLKKCHKQRKNVVLVHDIKLTFLIIIYPMISL
jgi:hypothetical protein